MSVAASDIPARDRLVMPMPEGLQPETQELWRLHMSDVRHLGQRDFGHVLAWIHAWDDYMVVRKELLMDGRRTVAQKYGETVSPLVRMMVMHRNEATKLELALGFNPQARMRLGITFAAEQSALEKLRGGGARKPPARMAVVS